MPVYVYFCALIKFHMFSNQKYRSSLHDTDESKEALLLELNQSKEKAECTTIRIGVNVAMNIVCHITDLKKMLLGQTMELEKLRKEGKGEL